MGIYDRPYYRTTPRGGFAEFQFLSITTWIIIINIIVFIADGVLTRILQSSPYEPINPPLTEWGYFSVTTAIYGLQLWRFFTFQFLHASVGHIFWNMLGLYFFGPIVESQLGGRKYLALYLSSGFAGAVMYVILWASHILIYSPASPLVGASAGLFGVLIAAARVAPNMTVTLLFPPIPLTLRTLAWIYVGIAAYSVLSLGANAGGEAAHLGGALWGYVLIRNEHWLNFLSPSRRGTRRRKAFRDWTQDMNH